MTSNKKLRLLLIISLSILFVFYIAWVVILNVTKAPIKIITAEIGKGVVENAYKYTVTEYSVYDNKKFKEEFGKEISYAGADDKMIVVSMDIEKVPCEDTRIYKFDILYNCVLSGDTFSQGVAYEEFTLINNESRKLEKVGDKIHLKLPYHISSTYIRPEKFEKLDSIPLSIVLNNADNTKKELILHR